MNVTAGLMCFDNCNAHIIAWHCAYVGVYGAGESATLTAESSISAMMRYLLSYVKFSGG